MIVAGIDPGKTGALVVLEGVHGQVYRVPLQRSGGKEVPAWSEWARRWGDALAWCDMIVIEQVGARPGQGVTSMFTFGRSMGFAHALAAYSGSPVYFVSPATWKPKMGLRDADKNASREKVRQLLPPMADEVARVKDDGVAEAALLALYGRKYL